MKDIPVWSIEGLLVGKINLPENVEYTSGRVSKGDSGVYYKGVGLPYVMHPTLNERETGICGRNPVFYSGYDRIAPTFKGKYGVFQDKFQPYFSDFIGTCGPKELKLLRNSVEFEMSGVRVKDCVEYDTLNSQRYFITEYDCDRRSFLPDGDVGRLLGLLFYMVATDWNIPWDKAGISDISEDSSIFDVADMFRSPHLVHKLGTVYSVLYSLAMYSKPKYLELLHRIGLGEQHSDNTFTVLAAMRFLTDIGVSYYDMIPPEVEHDNSMLRWFMLGNVLAQGRNCAHQEYPEIGEKVREDYRDKIFANKDIEHLRTNLWDLGLGSVCLE